MPVTAGRQWNTWRAFEKVLAGNLAGADYSTAPGENPHLDEALLVTLERVDAIRDLVAVQATEGRRVSSSSIARIRVEM